MWRGLGGLTERQIDHGAHPVSTTTHPLPVATKRRRPRRDQRLNRWVVIGGLATMLAPLCALILFGAILYRDRAFSGWIMGPAAQLGSDTQAPEGSSASALLPTATPSALISDAVADFATATVGSYPALIEATATQPLVVGPAATATAQPPFAPTAVMASTNAPAPTATTNLDATPIPPSPTALINGTPTAAPPTATSGPTQPVATATSPAGWQLAGLSIVEPFGGGALALQSVLVELINTSGQNQAISAIAAGIRLSDGTTLNYSGDDVYWTLRDAEFVTGLAPDARMPIEMTVANLPDGVTITDIDWQIQSNPTDDIGRTDITYTVESTSERNGQYCVAYNVVIPDPAITSGVFVSLWLVDDAGKVIGVGETYENAEFAPGGRSYRKTICASVLSGTVATHRVAIWGR